MKTISRYIMTLALLLTAVTGAWATEPKVINSEIDFESLKVGDILVEGFSISGPYSVMFYFNAGRAKKGETLLNEDVSFYRGYISSVGTNTVITLSGDAGGAAGTYTPIDENGQVANAWIVTSTNGSGNSDFHLSGYKYVAPTDEPAIDVKWDAATKTGTFTMPAFDVEIAPIYAPVAQWAEVETVKQLPAALEGIIAGQDAAIVTAGQSAQGTVMYAVTTSAEAAPALTAFSATVPTAKDYDDATTLYVWYYIQGQDTPDGQQATEENTFNDSEICTTPLTVQVLTNKFDITLNAANANTIEAGKATVTVGGTAATVTEGKLQGVKMGSEVKLTAKEGYKFRKVEVKKGGGAKPLANATTEDLGKVVGADGNIYANKDAAEAANTTAVAMICYVVEGHGLALALTDEVDKMNWSTAQTTCDAHTPAITGGKWMLASKGEWDNMISAAGSYSALRDGFSSVGGTNMQSEGYWSSTEDDSSDAWNYYFSNGLWSDVSKNWNRCVRACLAF